MFEEIPTKYHTVAKWPFAWPPQGGLRHLIFHAKDNGFHHVIKRVGRRILLDEGAFFEWVSKQNSNPLRGEHE